jgi:hypothetical protein
MKNLLSKWSRGWEIVEVPMFCILLALGSYTRQDYGTMSLWSFLAVFRCAINYRDSQKTVQTSKS